MSLQRTARAAVRILALAVPMVALAGCTVADASDGQPQPALAIEAACLLTDGRVVPLQVEVAVTDEQRQTGLMGRKTLAPDAGMLFVYDSPRAPDHGFWMFKTLIPLDIAYIDNAGVIRSIRQMYPCRASNGVGCPAYPAGTAVSQALEVNQGFFRDHYIRTGDRFSRDPRTCGR